MRLRQDCSLSLSLARRPRHRRLVNLLRMHISRMKKASRKVNPSVKVDKYRSNLSESLPRSRLIHGYWIKESLHHHGRKLFLSHVFWIFTPDRNRGRAYNSLSPLFALYNLNLERTNEG